jgi:hypothetical protein
VRDLRGLGGAAATLSLLGRGGTATSGSQGPLSSVGPTLGPGRLYRMSMLFLNFLEVVPGSAFVNASAIYIPRAWDVFVIYLLCVAKMSDVVSAPVYVLALALSTARKVLLRGHRWPVIAHQYLGRG